MMVEVLERDGGYMNFPYATKAFEEDDELVVVARLGPVEHVTRIPLTDIATWMSDG